MNNALNTEIQGAYALLATQYRMMHRPDVNIALLARQARQTRRYIRIMNNMALGVHRV